MNMAAKTRSRKKQSASLYDQLHAMGLRHPDDMSGLILTSLWRRLHGQPLRREEQVKHYQEFWRVHVHPEVNSNARCQSDIRITMSWDPTYSAGLDGPPRPPRQIHMGKCCSDGRVWSYEVDRGWYVPTTADLARWNHEPEGRYDPCAPK